MKKLLIIPLFFFGIILEVSAQIWISIDQKRQTTSTPARINLISSDINTSVINFSFDGFHKKEVQTKLGKSYTLKLEEGTPLLYEGAPDLLKLTGSIIIPETKKMRIKVIFSNYKEYSNIQIAPSKGNLTRDIDPASIPYTYSKIYKQNKFFPGIIAELRDPYIIRDYRGQSVIIYPFQYNPVTKILRVYYDITVKVTSSGTAGKNQLHRNNKLKTIDNEFKNVYSSHFLNYSNSKYTPVSEQGKMLIICYGQFISSMQSFVDWKNTIGIPTEIVNVSTLANSNAIKTYVSNYYNVNGLTYLLLIGDAVHVPTISATSGDSDNSYAYIVGNDHYPDIFVGRFSAEGISHVQTQVDRTIMYELNPPTNTNWYNKAIGIASNQGPGDDNEMDHEHIHNIRTDLLNYTYTACSELYDGTQTGTGYVDAPGNPTASMVSTEVNAGAGSIVYCGHGSTTGWGTSGFSNSEIPSLSNTNMLPFIWSVACVNGNFVGNTCFAETWMRSTNSSGQPIGAVATLMSTINQSWDPPMEAQDEMVDILVESYSNNIKRTFGGLSMSGCMKMNDTYGTNGDDMTDTWNLFGDPSLMVRTDTPQILTVSHNPTAPVGTSQFTVSCNVNDARVCLSVNNQIKGTGYISNGSVTITFPAFSSVDTMTVAITAYNHIPYIGTVPIIPAAGPYVSYTNNIVNDSLGNNNGQADYGENIMLNVNLQNSGVSMANGVTAILSSNDTNITITDSTESWGNIGNGSSLTKNNAFALSISNSVADNHSASFNLNIQDANSNSWNTSFNITLNAPSLSVGSLVVDDVAGGNGNGKLDPGETVNVIIQSSNVGHSDCFNTTGNLSSTSTYVTINSTTSYLDTILYYATKSAIFSISIGSSTPIGTSVNLNYNIVSGAYSAQNIFNEKVGVIDEDFETGNFNQYNWFHAGTIPWFVSTATPYEGQYCSQSGAITHNQTSELSITVNVMTTDTISFYKKVSCEDGPIGIQWDYLEFLIDNVSQDWWDGEILWSKESYAISAGTHTFKWVYSKDNMVSDGSDCAWIDYIVFPPLSITTEVDNSFINKTSLNAYPNPFVDNITFDYKITEASDIRLTLFNSIGQVVAVLSEINNQQPGVYSINFPAGDLPAGMYYCKLRTKKETITKKLILSE